MNTRQTLDLTILGMFRADTFKITDELGDPARYNNRRQAP